MFGDYTKWILTGITVVLAAVIYFIWTAEDPRELSLGKWRCLSLGMNVEITPDGIAEWNSRGGSGKVSYNWIQTDDSPYEVTVRYKKREVTCLVSFDGDNSMHADLQVWDQLTPSMRKQLARQNKAAGRPEREFLLKFQRVRSKTK